MPKNAKSSHFNYHRTSTIYPLNPGLLYICLNATKPTTMLFECVGVYIIYVDVWGWNRVQLSIPFSPHQVISVITNCKLVAEA